MKEFSIKCNGLVINAVASVDELYFEKQWRDVENGSYEPGIYNAFKSRIDADTAYFDLGAYIGYTCLYATQLAKFSFAFEPDPVAFAYLQENCKMNPNITNLQIFNSAAGVTDGTVKIMSSANGGNAGTSLMLSDGKSSWEVSMININRFIESRCNNEHLFIKIDIEGYEYQLLYNMKKIIRKYKPTVLLSMHPQIIAGSIRGNGILNKLNRRALMIKTHLRLISVLSMFPYKYKLNGNSYSLFQLAKDICTKGLLHEEDKDILVSFRK